MRLVRTHILGSMFVVVSLAYGAIGNGTTQTVNLEPGTSLGPLRLKGYCTAHGFADSSSWNCVRPNGERVPINMRDACNFQYRNQRGVAVAPNDDIRFDPSRWTCVVEDVVTVKRTSELPVGVYRAGPGVVLPRVTASPKPHYTVEALRAKVQGTVLVECVVDVNGLCRSIEVVRSLDSTFGLDEQAVASVRKWRFHPGAGLGMPAPVLVTVEVSFHLR